MSAPYGSRPRTPLPDVSVLFPWRAWTRHPWFRSWTTWVFVALIAVPPLATTLPTSGSDDILLPSTAFAFYFAAAWFLVLWKVVAPGGVTGPVLALVAGIALVVEAPVAMALERALDIRPDSLISWIVVAGVPEELAKLLPVAALALVHRRAWHMLSPRDFLFLGATCGLVFGAVEAVKYANDYMVIDDAQMGLLLAWRLLTGPIIHACWAGLSAYFLGLASRYRDAGPWLALAGLGIGLPALLHGLNNWVAGEHGVAWAAVEGFSALLFLGYARIGLVATAPPPAPAAVPWAVGRPPAPVAAPWAAGHPSTPVVDPVRPAPAPWSPPPRSGTPLSSTPSARVPDLPTARLPVVGRP